MQCRGHGNIVALSDKGLRKSRKERRRRRRKRRLRWKSRKKIMRRQRNEGLG